MVERRRPDVSRAHDRTKPGDSPMAREAKAQRMPFSRGRHFVEECGLRGGDGRMPTDKTVDGRTIMGWQRLVVRRLSSSHPRPAHVLFAPGDARRAGARHPGARRARGPDDDAALHAPQCSGHRRCDPVVGRACLGLPKPLRVFGDILDTRSSTTASD